MNIDQALGDLRSRIAYPPEPDVTAAVIARVAETAVPWWRRPRPVAALAATAIVLLVVGLVPATREQVASWLGIRGVTVETLAPPAATTAQTPTPTTAPSPTAADDSQPVQSGLGAGLVLGREVISLTTEQVAGFRPLYPAIGLPDREFVDEGGRVWQLYGVREGLPETQVPGVGMIVTQFRAESPGITKRVATEDVAFVDFGDGLFGLWLVGPHQLLLPDAAGSAVDGRSAGNTLLWEQGDLTIRIETALARDAAVAIAEKFE